MKTVTGSLDDARRFLALLHRPGDVFELRAVSKRNGKPQIAAGYFDDMNLLARSAIERSGRDDGVYITINPVHPGLLSRLPANRVHQVGNGDSTSDRDVVARRHMLIDVDPVRPAGISSDDTEHAAAIDLARRIDTELSAIGWPTPILADSGNGAHLLYAIDLPRDDGKLVERVLAELSRRYSTPALKIDEKVFNPARISKIYGTLTRKGQSTPDRPHRIARIVSAPNELVIATRAQLEALAPTAVTPPRSSPTNGAARKRFDLDAWIAEHLPGAEAQPWSGGEHGQRKWLLKPCPFNAAHDRGEAYIVEMNSGAISAGCKHDSCTWTWRELRELFQPGAYERRASADMHRTLDRESPPDPGEHPNAPREQLPQIRIDVKIVEVVNAAQAALLRAGGIYVRGTRLAHITRDRCTLEWLKVPDGLPLIAELGDAALRERMSAAADWEKYDARSKSWKPALPPDWAPKTLKERGDWTFPVLAGISDTPVLRPDGTIHAVRGYDAASRMIFDPRCTWPTIKHNPSRHDANVAYHELCEPFCDFTFAAPHYLAAAIAYILTLIGRSAIAGAVPAFMSTASTPGAGKGLTLDIGATIATGHDAPKMLPTHNEEENRKRLLPIAIAAPATVVIDNVEGMFGSPAIAAAITSSTIEDRVLGVSENKRVPFRTTLGITGNNIMLHSDFGRRIIPIEIANDMEHPEDREGFRYPRLKQHVREHRHQLVAAALTLLRAFIAAGMPKHSGAEKGSFEEWDALVRGAIIWAGAVDPCGGVALLRKNSDNDLEKLRGLVEAWLANSDLAIGATVADLLQRAGAESAPAIALRGAIAAYADPRKPMDPTTLGHRLRALRHRPCTVGGKLYRIEHAPGKRAGVQRWRVADRESWCVAPEDDT